MRVGKRNLRRKVRAYIVTAEVRFEFSGKDFKGGTLSNTISPDQAEDLARSGSRETMELEGIGSVSVGDCGF